MKKTIIFLFLLLLIPSLGFTAIINSASCSQANVQTAISSASAGDTVTVPSCSSTTWTSGITITRAMTIQGAGEGNTNIVVTGGTAFTIAPSAIATDTNSTFRVTGISFNLSSAARGWSVTNNSTTPMNKLIIDHNAFINSSFGAPFLINGTIYGVIHSNTISGWPHFDNYGMGSGGGASWNGLTFAYGSASNLYYEDNTITLSTATGPTAYITGGHGGRYSYRYNAFVNSSTRNLTPMIDAHGNQPSGIYATMGIEVYGNSMTCSPSVNVMPFVDHRGGMAAIHNNKMIGCGTVTMRAREEYDDSISATTNEQPQHVSSSYYFNNRDDTTLITATESSDCCSAIAENSEFWNQNVSFNGTAGIGCGAIGDRPATCTVGVGYWTTSQPCSSVSNDNIGISPTAALSGTLSKCTAANTWTDYYTPYTYPHPLREESGGDTTAPTVLSFRVYATTTNINFSENIVSTSGAAFTVASLSGGALTLTCPAVSTAASTMTCTNSRTVYQSETGGTYGYTGTKVTDVATNALAEISSTPSIVNMSTEVETPPTYRLTVTVLPADKVGGTVTSSPSGISATSAAGTITLDVENGTVVTLGGFRVNEGWMITITYSGDCNASGQVTVSANKSCNATFTPIQLWP